MRQLIFSEDAKAGLAKIAEAIAHNFKNRKVVDKYYASMEKAFKELTLKPDRYPIYDKEALPNVRRKIVAKRRSSFTSMVNQA